MEKAKKPHLKAIKALLKERSVRDKENSFIAEGSKIVQDALRKKCEVLSVFISGRVIASPSIREIVSHCQKNNIPVFRTAAVEFEKLSSLNNSQGILAILKKPRISILKKGNLNVLCDGIQDPGNLGTIIRTSVAFGVSSVFLLGATVDIFNPKVIRSSSGAVMDIPVIHLKEDDLDNMKHEGFYLISGDSERSGGKELGSIVLPEKPVIIAFGNEGRGLSSALLKRTDEVFYIPIDAAAESLNVTAAAAITIHHFSVKMNLYG